MQVPTVTLAQSLNALKNTYSIADTVPAGPEPEFSYLMMLNSSNDMSVLSFKIDDVEAAWNTGSDRWR